MNEIFLPQKMDRAMIEDFLPHKGKMFLQDRITSYDDKKNIITTEFDVKKDCIFYDEESGGIPSWAFIEIMAQGISALASIKRRLRNDTTPAKAGVVLSVSDFKSEKDVFAEGQTLYMYICEDLCLSNVYKYFCRLYLNKEDENACLQFYISVMEVDDIKGVLEKNV